MNKKLKLHLMAAGAVMVSITMAGQEKQDRISHYSTMDAMRNSIYTGDISVQQVKLLGDFGLGTFNNLDGEMIVLDGKVYRVLTSGSIEEADDAKLSPFLSVTHFKSDAAVTLEKVKNFAELQQLILQNLPFQNRFYAIKIEVSFKDVSVGGAVKVSGNESKGIAELMKTRPVYRKKDVKGTIVGFFSPSYVGGIDLSPFHFHFISNDKTFAGHLLEGDLGTDPVKVLLDQKNAYQLILPKDNSESYNRVWKSSESKSQY